MLFNLLLLTFITITHSLTPTETRNCILNCARDQFGKPYVLNTEGPDTFDAPGLVYFCYEKCGYSFSFRPLTHELSYMGIAVSESNLLHADLVFPVEDHVQLYSGEGHIIHAPVTGGYVKEQPMYGFLSARRLVGLDDPHSPGESQGPSGEDTAQKGKRVTVIAETLDAHTSASLGSDSAATYCSGETVPFDSYVASEGVHWLSFIANSGERRYVASKTERCNTTPCAEGGHGTAETLTLMQVWDAASTAAGTVGHLDKGETVEYDVVFSSDARTWVSWVDQEGRRNYIVARDQDGEVFINPCP